MDGLDSKLDLVGKVAQQSGYKKYCHEFNLNNTCTNLKDANDEFVLNKSRAHLHTAELVKKM